MSLINSGLHTRPPDSPMLAPTPFPSSETDDSGPHKDAGNRPNDHYKLRLSPLRYYLRSVCLPIVRTETEVLSRLQKRIRSPALDFYFAWTANLATHTFYVIMLPLPIWFGHLPVTRDLVYVLGLGIYFSGFAKDFLCLPRPRLPPLHRITMLSYTTQEYGWPSSHSANATAVTLLLLARVVENAPNWPFWQLLLALVFLFVYWGSLIFGRLYCGMHGFFDVLAGSLIGVLVFLFRHVYGAVFDAWLFDPHRNGTAAGIALTILMIIAAYAFLIHIHSEPVDDCPCFDDSVAFIGVLIGIDLLHLACHVTNIMAAHNPHGDPILVPYDFSQSGVARSALRLGLGVGLVLVWKALSKPFIFTLLPPIYKVVGIYVPRRNYKLTAHTTKTTRQIRSQSLSNLRNNERQGGELNQLLMKDVSRRDEVGPEGEIDIYELLDYASSRANDAKTTEIDPIIVENGSASADFPGTAASSGNVSRRRVRGPETSEGTVTGKSELLAVDKSRYDVETVGRLFVYAGIPISAIWGFFYVAQFCGL